MCALQQVPVYGGDMRQEPSDTYAARPRSTSPSGKPRRGAARYASGFSGPFRDAASNAPAFSDRRAYSTDAARIRESMRDVS